MKKYSIILKFLILSLLIFTQSCRNTENSQLQKLAVLEPLGVELDSSEEWILPFIQHSMTRDFKKFTDYFIDDFVRTERGTDARFLVTGLLTKTLNSYALRYREIP